MKTYLKLLAATLLSLSVTVTYAQDDSSSDRDELKIAALEALISAPPERALPRV
jgi:hypothetical protein